jgi:hypothetical protein
MFEFEIINEKQRLILNDQQDARDAEKALNMYHQAAYINGDYALKGYQAHLANENATFPIPLSFNRTEQVLAGLDILGTSVEEVRAKRAEAAPEAGGLVVAEEIELDALEGTEKLETIPLRQAEPESPLIAA